MDKEKAKAELKILLDRYKRMKAKKETGVKAKEEEKAKIKLIRPLFEHVLGWNFEEDVTTEERTSRGLVDYGFRINEVPKFFLEAKSLKEDLDNPSYFRQAVSYAYYKGCPWAVQRSTSNTPLIYHCHHFSERPKPPQEPRTPFSVPSWLSQ